MRRNYNAKAHDDWIAVCFELGSLGAGVEYGPVVVDYGKHVTAEDPIEAKIAKEVRHELLMLPWYSLFDDLEYTVQDRTVTLSGAVTSEHAATKSAARSTTRSRR